MKTFSLEKNGYTKTEVNAFIFESEKQIEDLNSKILKLEKEKEILNEKLDFYKNNEQLISKSIQAAVTAGEHIKQKNREIYLNEITKIKKLYEKWETFLNNLSREYPSCAINADSQLILKSLSEAIDEVLNESEDKSRSSQLESLEKSFNQILDYQKTIISGKNSGEKSGYKNVIVRNKKPSQKTLMEDKFEQEHKKESQRLNLDRLEKSFEKFNLKANEDENFIDNFLNNSKNEVAFAYEKNLINTTSNGFDLKEAVNPTMDLEEIMKAFDLDD